MKGTLSYLTEDGIGLVIDIEKLDLEYPEFKATATIMKQEELQDAEHIDVIMAAGMRQLMDMLDWEEMFEVELANFEIGAIGDGVGVMPKREGGAPLDGMIMGGPMGEA